MQGFVHYFLHLGFPAIIAYTFFRVEWKKAYLLFLGTMLADLDHLLATPIFQADRCSIGFHPLHSYYAMAVYVLMVFVRSPVRLIGLGLLFHMITDTVDCVLTYRRCAACLVDAPAGDFIRSVSRFIDTLL